MGQLLPEFIDSAVKAFSLANSESRHFERSSLPPHLTILIDNVSVLSDEAWESVRYAPILLGVEEGTWEKDLTQDQADALQLIVDYVNSRQKIKVKLLYASQALDNLFIDNFKQLNYARKVMAIFTESLRLAPAEMIKDFVENLDVQSGLKNAMSVFPDLSSHSAMMSSLGLV